ncbi:Yim1p KNAG_0A05250 [Huiozyma naganishii CBS 8797]|uniref:Enoyl reductase (ER) domain-containing protein n=1 Tax=Huiozyma naganishii (strain ATCC MYA-139 / BCRC 22969 / CBS 8797 / KCTC 17520 / NBRC 10181 / NCYC 3082 / Yp74L-3) TaxID=1071383 RepID=J7S3U4_HUIN7|nr:hypothetical protein KNAG_0A05250 [Kazachstania naganishii CBS 8797]CCK68191.1 hypothetical protein KNAG_0A05250 [Kazachstania naganishii CBS 8797]
MSATVTQKSVTFVNNSTPAAITTRELNLDTCYSDTELVVKVHSVALNPIDFFVHDFCSPWVSGSGLETYSRDFSGEVVRKGAKVNPKWNVGDHINGNYQHLLGERGAMTNYLILNPQKQLSLSHMQHFKDNIGEWTQWDLCASYPLVFGTAYAVLFHKKQAWTPESRILVNGASTAVSQCLIQICKSRLGIRSVVGTCSSSSVEYNKKAGFDVLIPYDQPGKMDKIREYVKEHGKFDLIFDSVGTSEYYPVIQELLKPIGEHSYYNTIAGDGKLKYQRSEQHYKDIIPYKDAIRIFNPWRKFNFSHSFCANESGAMELASIMIQKGQFTPVIDSAFSFKDFQKAIDRLKTNKAKGKVLVRVCED